jgi:hypothetical protein
MSFTYSRGANRDGLQPAFRADVETLLEADPARWLITHAFRSLEQQNALYVKHLAGGPLAAPPGKSAHNFGLAVDVALDGDPETPAWELNWDIRDEDWQRLFARLKAHKRLQSGVRFSDGAHIQRYRWTRYKVVLPAPKMA